MSYRALLSDLPLLSIVLVSFMGMLGTNVASPALPQIASGLSVSEARVGLVMSAYFFPTVVMVPVVGVLADIYGRRRLVLVGLVLFGAAGTAIAFADSFAAVLALRAIQGVGFAGMSPLAVAVIGDLYTGPEGAAAQGLRGSAHGIAQIAAPAIAGFLAEIAWNYPFFLFAATLPVFVLVLVYLPETAPDSDAPDLRAEIGGYARSIRVEARDPNLALLFAGTFVAWLLKSTVFTFIPLFVVGGLGETAFVAGLILSFGGVVRTVVSPLSGLVIARTSHKRGFLGTVVVGGIAAFFVPFAPTALWVGVLVGVYGVGNAFTSAILNDAVATIASAEHRGGIVSGMNAMKQVGNVTAPAVFGVVLAAGGFGLLFGAAAVTAFGYAAVAGVALNPSIGDGGDGSADGS